MRLLKSLYKISSPSGKESKMIHFIIQYIKKLNVKYEIDKLGNIYITKGVSQSYPCVVAHLDEVHNCHAKGFEVCCYKDILFGYNNLSNSFAGIGADDKNGIWICLKCLEDFDTLKCSFFVSEEIGCIGSQSANMDFFSDCRFVIQCDRQGNSDLVTDISGVELCSKEFIHDMNASKHSYKITTGFQTDVLILKERDLEVSCINLSCGYFEPHTIYEHTNMSDLRRCLYFVQDIILNCTDVYQHSYVPIEYNCRFLDRYVYYRNQVRLRRR